MGGGFVDISNKMTMTSMGVVVNFNKLRAAAVVNSKCHVRCFLSNYSMSAIFIDSSTRDGFHGDLFT